MAFVPGFKYDIFVSYARHDNVLIPGQEPWVTNFMAALDGLLKHYFGEGIERLEVAFDKRTFVSGNEQMEGLLEDARSSALFLAICSPNYHQEREWTRKELDAFCERAHDSSRIFAVEKLPIGAGLTYPAPLDTHNRLPLWQNLSKDVQMSLTPIQAAWAENLVNLITGIRKKLKEMQAAAPKANAPAAQKFLPAAGGNAIAYRRVFLSQVVGDPQLERQRRQLLTALEQFGVPVFPAAGYRLGRTDFEAALEGDLAAADIFVQLLGEAPGLLPPDVPEGYPALQLAAAKARKAEILEWRSPEIDLANVEDANQAALLRGAEVIACGFEEFRQTVMKAAAPPPPPPEPQAYSSCVEIFIGADERDGAAVEQMQEILGRHNILSFVTPHMEDAITPAGRRFAENIAAEIASRVVSCDGLIVVYGATAPGPGRAIISNYGRKLGLRSGPAKIVGIVYVDPANSWEDKGIGGIRPKIMHISARERIDEQVLGPIIAALGSAPGQQTGPV